jgi:hypothetical protein
VPLIAGVVLLVLGGIFRLAVVPAMLKFPTNLDITVRYQGKQESFVDAASGAPLARPRSLALRVTRHVKADGGESTGSRAVLDEDITAVARGGGTLRQQNRYVIDRKKIVNVADPKAFAFTPENVVDRGGAYRLAFPFDLSQGTVLTMYSNDTNSTYRAASDQARPTGEVDGLRVLNYVARQRPHELSPVYLAALQQATGLPKSTTLRRLAPVLRRAVVDIAAIGAALPAQDQARIARVQDRATTVRGAGRGPVQHRAKDWLARQRSQGSLHGQGPAKPSGAGTDRRDPCAQPRPPRRRLGAPQAPGRVDNGAAGLRLGRSADAGLHQEHPGRGWVGSPHGRRGEALAAAGPADRRARPGRRGAAATA